MCRHTLNVQVAAALTASQNQIMHLIIDDRSRSDMRRGTSGGSNARSGVRRSLILHKLLMNIPPSCNNLASFRFKLALPPHLSTTNSRRPVSLSIAFSISVPCLVFAPASSPQRLTSASRLAISAVRAILYSPFVGLHNAAPFSSSSDCAQPCDTA